MKNYTTIFTGNNNDVQRIYNNLAERHICAIIRIKTKFERINYGRDSDQTLQDILVHQDELKHTKKLIKRLTGKKIASLIKTDIESKPKRRQYV